MTLVVAEMDPLGISMVADTRLTDPRSTRQADLFQGALKLVILHRGLCVGYAGDNADAIDAIQDLGIRPDTMFDHAEVLESLLRFHQRRRSVDFVVAALSPTPVLRVIRGGAIGEPSGGRCWIGDQQAFDVFQRCAVDTGSEVVEVPPDVAPSVRSRLRLSAGMKAVIDDDAVRTVGDVLVAVLPSKHGFIYSCSLQAHVVNQIVPPGTTTLTWGHGAATGSFTQTLMTPLDADGVGAVAVYIRETGTGAVFYPMHSPRPIVIRGSTHDDFRNAVREAVGIDINGIRLD